MRLFWKIYCVVFISFAAVIVLSSYVSSAKRIYDAEKSIAEEHRTIGLFIASDIERRQSESKWPFESLKRLSEHHDFIFWWIVKEDGIIHLADKASFIGLCSYDYFPQVTGFLPDGNVFLNKQQNYGIFTQSLTTGEQRWTFWLGFSTKHIAEANRKIILSTVIYSASALVIVGFVLYFVIIHFLRPVKNFTIGVEKIGKGELDYRVEVKSNDELSYLARSFNKMSEDLQGTTTSIDNLNQEITERLKAEEKQRQVAEEWKTTFDSITDLVSIHDKDFKIVRANKSFAKAFNMKPDDIIGKTCCELIHGTKEPSPFCPHKRTLNTGKPNRREFFEPRLGIHIEASTSPLFDENGQVIASVHIAKDITERKQAEAELKIAQKTLIDTARRVGMAEVAANVLHNVGNVLNSINVSATVIREKVTSSELADLEKVASIINEHTDDLGTFLTEHPQGKHIPVYLTEVSKCLQGEQTDIISRLKVLTDNVQHIKDIVNMQQSYAKVSGVEVQTSLSELAEDAIQINSAGLERHGTRLIREFEELGDVEIDKQKLLQILVNLVSNAKYALSGCDKEEKLLTIRIYKHSEESFRVEVADNGVGISEDNLTKIFSHGFTTKKDGHGFGLHSSALASSEIGGSLSVHSDGLGQGATFTLELPFKPVEVMK